MKNVKNEFFIHCINNIDWTIAVSEYVGEKLKFPVWLLVTRQTLYPIKRKLENEESNL